MNVYSYEIYSVLNNSIDPYKMVSDGTLLVNSMCMIITGEECSA